MRAKRHGDPENRKLLAEEVIDLPNFLGLWLPQSVPELKSLPARSRGRITFGSFNRRIKQKMKGPFDGVAA